MQREGEDIWRGRADEVLCSVLGGFILIFSAAGEKNDLDKRDDILRNAWGHVALRVADETTNSISSHYLASRFLVFLFVICDKNEEEKCHFSL